jgi:short-subunit dehydrogenase
MALPTPTPDRTCLVTGASSGIGTAIACELARRGHGVTLVARREDRLVTLADELRAEYDVRAVAIAADLTDDGSRRRIPDELDARGLTVDVLVNNAGFSTTGPVHRSDPDREVALVRTDVEAVVHLCSLFLPGTVERGAGAILNVASTAAFQPMPGQAAYAAAKSFVLSYSHALRGELRGKGVTVTALCPGPVQTEFIEIAGFEEGDANSALPSFMWETAPDVARAAVDGLAKGHAVVIPGTANRVGARFAYLTPRKLLLPILARQHPALKD